jgi:hypothetical protein
MNYVPVPLDTSRVTLDQDVAELIELLAKNAHDVWSQRRLLEGWRWGRERSDSRHETPCLVPYEELPDSEKQYDRDLASETLKAIVALGYRIVKSQ